MFVLDLVWHMYLNCSGYSTSGQDFVKALIQQEFPIYVDTTDYKDKYNFVGLSSYNIDLFHTLQYKQDISQTLSVWNFPAAQLQNTGKINVGYTDFEVTKMPATWAQQCNTMNEIWTSSSFCKQVFLESSVNVPIKVIPHAIDNTVWSPNVNPLPIQNKRGFTFLFASEWMPRKGIYELLEAWFRAFDDKDDVCLILKTYLGSHGNVDNIKIEISQIRNKLNLRRDRCAPILLYSSFLNEYEMPQLFKTADILIAPSLGEGFGLCVAQAQTMGLPVIATRWSALKEICNDDIGYMIEIDGLELVSQKQIELISSYQGANWAKLNINDLVDKMRHIYNYSDELKQKSKKCLQFAKRFHYDNVAGQLIKRINALLGRVNINKTQKIIFCDKDSGLISITQNKTIKNRLQINPSDFLKLTPHSYVAWSQQQKYLKLYFDMNLSNYCWVRKLN